MSTLTFLSAAVPLVKRFDMVEGVIVKHSYPDVKHVTSKTYDVANIKDMYHVIREMALAPNPPCIFKGELTSPLANEARRGMGKDDALTDYAVLDFDDAPFASHEEAMRALGLHDVSYVWQFSSSAGLDPARKTLNGHAFIMLTAPLHPQVLKAWFMHANLHIDVLKNALTLSKGKQALSWTLDIVISDNNRMVYIGEPIFRNMESPIPKDERIQLVTKKSGALNVSRIAEYSLEALRNEARAHIKTLRLAEGLTALKGAPKQVGEWEVQAGVGAATRYQVIDDGGEFIRYNINGGDSQAYWHSRNSFELLHNFKGEPSMYMKEILPQRYAELCRMQADAAATPNDQGDILLAFREKVTSRYYKGIWNEKNYTLDIHTVGARIDLEDFMQGHGRTVGPYVPEWHIIYDPRQKFVIDQDTHTINSFVPPPYLRGRENIHARKTTYPTIQRVLDSAVGVGIVQEHFLNWLAVIVQHRRKTGTAWILHGTQGTGKDLLVNHILRPIFTSQYQQVIRPDEVSSQFNSWLEKNLLVFVNEIDVDLFINMSAVESRLKQSITDSFMPVRKMRTDAINPENFINIIFGSNKPQPTQIPLNDRRFNVGTYQTQRFETTTEEVEQVLPTEIEAFAYYLSTREADINKAAQVLQTADRAAIQALGVSSIDEFAHDIISANATAYATIMKRFFMEDKSKISRDELHLLFSYAIGDIKQGPNKFTSFLRHRGIVTKKIWTPLGSVYGIEVEWKNKPEYRPVVPTTHKLKRVS